MRLSLCSFLFQLCHVSAQNLAVALKTIPALPAIAVPLSLLYDEPGQFIYLAGSSTGSFDNQTYYGGLTDTFLSKHYMNGSRVWSRLVGGTGHDSGFKVIQNPATSELFLLGKTSGTLDGQLNAGNIDGILAKFFPNGTEIYRRLFGGTGNEGFANGFVDVNSGYLVLFGGYNGRPAIVLSSLSNSSYMIVFALPTTGSLTDFSLTDNGTSLFASGMAYSSVDGQKYFGGALTFSKINHLNGTRYWTRMWGSVKNDLGISVEYDPTSHQIFVGGTTSDSLIGQNSSGGLDAYLMCATDNGTYVWTTQFGSATDDQAFSLAIHWPTGALIMAGIYGSFGFVSVFSQNGTMLQLYLQPPQAEYHEIVFSSSNNWIAYMSDTNGNFVRLDVSLSSSAVAFMTTPTVVTTRPPISFPGSSASSLLQAQTSSGTTSSYSETASSYVDSSSSHVASSTETQQFLTTSSNNDFGNNLPASSAKLSSPLIPVASGAGFFVFITMLTFWCCLFRSRRVAKAARRSETTQDTSTTVFSTVISDSSFIQQTTLPTMFPSSYELSLPGYLMFEADKHYRLTKKIAQGGGGTVFLADTLTLGMTAYGTTIVVKTIGTKSGAFFEELTERQQKAFQQEVSIMHYFRDEKYIAKLLGWSKSPPAIIMKLYALGSLDNWIHGNAYKSKIYQVQFMEDIARGIFAMHQVGFVHSDLKPQNVLVDKDEQDQLFCCLTDFGISQIVDATTLLVKDFAVTNLRGISSKYAAPEAFQRFRSRGVTVEVPGEVMKKVDLYSLAVIMSEILERRHPWKRSRF